MAQIFRVTSSISEGVRTYRVKGQLFFASAEDFSAAIDLTEQVAKVRIDLTNAHLWDLTGVQAIDMAVLKFRRAGATIEVIGMNDASATIMDKFAVHDQPGAMERMLGH